MDEMNYTPFSVVYDSFLSKITDDMYMELTPQDTDKILQELLISALPKFEFPRQSLEYEDKEIEGEFDEIGEPFTTQCFVNKLTQQEVNIIATYMIVEWLGQQLATIENTRMKFSGADFKMTSQANHLQKLLSLLGECQRQSRHLQRLYKRRRPEKSAGNTELYRSNWDIFKTGVYY